MTNLKNEVNDCNVANIGPEEQNNPNKNGGGGLPSNYTHFQYLSSGNQKPFIALDYKSIYEKGSTGNNYTRGCKWAPDGSCLLVASDDKKFRLFNLSESVAKGEFNDEKWIAYGWKNDIIPAVIVQENEDMFDYTWYPSMNSHDPTTCCFAAACRDMPVHLWDAWTGQLICSYSSYDHMDELTAARSLCFSPDSVHLVCGFNKCIRVFNTSRPGRTCTQLTLDGQSDGIISCMAFHPVIPRLFAAGSYSGSIGFYSLQTKKNFSVFNGHNKGVTHLKFSSDGTKLFSGTRKDSEILCWDIRNPGAVLYKYKREVNTNQRIYFDLSPNDQFLATGSTNGRVSIWDQNSEHFGLASDADGIAEIPETSSFPAHNDCTNGISIHPHHPLLATSSGQRHIKCSQAMSEDSDDSNGEHKITDPPENSVKLWWLANI